MTFLFKLSRRTAASMVALAGTAVLLACSEAAPREFLSPDPGGPSTPSSTPVSLVVVGTPSILPYDQTYVFQAYGRVASGDSVPVAVSWVASAGQISADGRYRGTVPGSHTVTAFAVGSPSVSGTSRIDVSNPGPLFETLDVQPKPVFISGGAHVMFGATARLQSGANTLPTVTWRATGGGTVSATGEFAAGLVPGSYAVIATTLDGLLSDTALVTIEPAELAAIQLQPRVVTMPGGGTQEFEVATTWTDGTDVVPELEWISSAGTVEVVSAAAAGGPQAGYGDRLLARFLASRTPGTHRLVVRHPGSGKSDTASVTITPVLESVEVTPGSVDLLPGVTAAFTAKGRMSDGVQSNVSVSWTATGGSVTGSGVYTAGATPGVYRVIARLAGGTMADTSVIRIAAPPAATLTGLSITPATGTVPVNGSVEFAASATWSDGSSALPELTWTAQGGSVSPQGAWTAPATAGTYRIIARQSQGTKADTAVFTVVVPPAGLTALAVSPESPAVQGGQSVEFQAQATWSDGSTTVPPLTWTATGGNVNDGGRWTSPNVSGVYRVVARANSAAVADTAVVTVAETPRVTTIRVSPRLGALNPGGTMQLSSEVTWSDGQAREVARTWSATGGSVSMSGLFTAGALAGQVMVIASCSGCLASDTARFSITEPVVPAPVVTQLILNPSSLTLAAGASHTFQVAAAWSDGSETVPPLAWTVAGGTRSGLTYTAGATAGTYKVIVRDAGGTKADTSVVTITAGTAGPATLVISPDSVAMASGFSTAFSVSGSPVTPAVTWSATGGTITTGGVYTAGVLPGTYRVVATCVGCALADTAKVVIGAGSPPPPPPPPPPAPVGSVPLTLRRLDGGSGAVLVSNGIPLPPGTLQPTAGSSVRVFLGGNEVPAYVEVLKGKHKDGSARSVLVQFTWPAGAGTQAAVEFNATPTQPRLAKTNSSALMPSAVALPSDPNYLVSTEVVGRTITRANTPTSIGMLAKYENDFDTWSNTHWGLYGGLTPAATNWAALNYYDRGLSHFAFWARTGNPALWERAALTAVSYRIAYLEPNGFAATEYWAQMEGLAVHYWLTGDDRSRQAVYKTAENLHRSRGGTRMTNTTSHEWMDNRNHAKVLSGKVLALMLDAPAFGAVTDWAAAARVDLPMILSTQTAEGSYRFFSQCGESSNFMSALLNDAYVMYYDHFEADSRIPVAIQKSLDWLWSTQWKPSAMAFNYYSAACTTPSGGGGGSTPSADLNGLYLEAWGWLYHHTGNAAYRNQAEQILQGGVQGTWVQGTKQFNQEYFHSWRYLWYR